MWYFVIALVIILAVMFAVPGDGAEIPKAVPAIALRHA
jgi:hypothetical protein